MFDRTTPHKNLFSLLPFFSLSRLALNSSHSEFVTSLDTVEVQSRRDVGQVAESLGGVAELRTTEGDFFRQHAHVVAEVGDGLKHVDGGGKVLFGILARSDQGFDQPQSTHDKGPFTAADA